MFIVAGKFNQADVYAEKVEKEAISQITELCNQPFTEGSKIAIMPDTHAGAGCTIGTTMTLKNSVVPNLVGVDIGCGMEVAMLDESEIDLEKLDNFIRRKIPNGNSIRKSPHKYTGVANFMSLRCSSKVDMTRAKYSIGTLGGGNHFIEVDKDDKGNLYLVVHSGSRYLGKQVAEYYQKLAYFRLTDTSEVKKKLIDDLKKQGRQKEIEKALKKVKTPKVNKDLAYLTGQDFANYLNDMKHVQFYAHYNRKAIVDDIVAAMGWTVLDRFTTVHNYIDMDSMILRKGAISAKEGERVIIPLNMRDGSIIAVGKGNPDWNCSAPHGAGRLMSRNEAKKKLSLAQYQYTMADVYSTSVNYSTLDEAPMAYKPMEEILGQINDTVDVLGIIKPIYNFKAS